MKSIFPYEEAVDATEVGMDTDGIDRVARQFHLQQERGHFPGGQLVVRRYGKVVLKTCCGIARGWNGRGGATEISVRDDTPFPVYSTGKPMAAVVVAMLEARGMLDVHASVCSILPEFSGMGRDDITILDVLTHKAGIILPDLINDHKIWAERDRVWQHLLKSPPKYLRGTFAYMPGEYGIILDRIVEQLTGQTIETIFRSEISEPLGLDQMHYGLGSHKMDELAWSYWLGKDHYSIAGMDVADAFEERNNDLAVFAAANPAFSMVSDAASLAAFYAFLVDGGVKANGTQIIPEALLRQYTSRQVAGWNRSVKTYLALGRGFMTGMVTPSFFGWYGTSGCFGHAGMFSSLAFADHKTGLSAAIVTNGNKSISDFFSRFVKITHGLKVACK